MLFSPPRPVLALLTLCLATSASSAQEYEVDHLGNFQGTSSYALDINDGGSVVGYSMKSFPLGSQFYAWASVRGREIMLPPLAGTMNAAYALDNSSRVVGYSFDTLGHLVGFGQDLFLNQAPHSLPPLYGNFSTAKAINDAGTVVGISHSPYVSGGVREYRGVIWNQGVPTELPTLGGTFSDARGINQRGIIVGAAKDQHDMLRAIRYQDGALIQLPDLSFGACANAINDWNHIVGWVFHQDGSSSAAMWVDGQLSLLSDLGGTDSYAWDINNSDIIVGSSQLAPSQGVATVWRGGDVFDINQLPTGTHNFTDLKVARGINDSGQIVGWGTVQAGQTRAFIAHPEEFRMALVDEAVAGSGQMRVFVAGGQPGKSVTCYWGSNPAGGFVGQVPVLMADPQPLRAGVIGPDGTTFLGAIYPPAAAAGALLAFQTVEFSWTGALHATDPVIFRFRP